MSVAQIFAEFEALDLLSLEPSMPIILSIGKVLVFTITLMVGILRDMMQL